MRTFTASTSAPPEVAWRLLARPADWGRWSPHVRGAWGLGDPEVRRGACGAARLLGVVPVPARVTGKRDGRSWSWRVGAVVMTHRVERRAGGGATVAIDLTAPGPLERAVALAYGPLLDVSLRRLAREAERVVGTPAR
jgi:polyketide cyclase/dehydrase/lipid transport protein